MRIITYQVKPAEAERNAALVRAVFAELAEVRPPGLRYACYQDGVSFVHVADGEGLTTLPAFRAFLDGHADRCEVGSTVSEVVEVGAYPGS